MPFENSVMKVFVSGMEANYQTPWLGATPSDWTGSAFVIKYRDKNYILTNAHVAQKANYIQVKLAADSERYTARVNVIGHDCDLALLDIADEKFWKYAEPLELGEGVLTKGDVIALGFPVGGNDFCITDGTVTRTEVGSYSHSGAPLLSTQIDASIDHGNSGGPVIAEEKVVGVVHQGGEKLGAMIPLPIVTHFLEDVLSSKKYKGFPEISMSIQTMENPKLREYFGMTKEMTGILVNSIDVFSPAHDILQPNDVLLAIDDIPILNDGMIKHRSFDTPISYTYAISNHQLYDKVKFEILRDKKLLTIEMELSRRIHETNLYPSILGETEPAYFSRHGIVVMPITVNFVSSSIVDGIYRGPSGFHSLVYGDSKKTKELSKELMIGRVLDDKETQCYGSFVNSRINKIDGKKVYNMWSAIKALDAPKKEHMIETTDKKVMVLSHLSPVKDELLRKRYHIAKPQSSQYTPGLSWKRVLMKLRKHQAETGVSLKIEDKPVVAKVECKEQPITEALRITESDAREISEIPRYRLA